MSSEVAIARGAQALDPTVEELKRELAEARARKAELEAENARLFEAKHARTRELQESLDQLIATADILRVISTSPNDATPVFDAIVHAGRRLIPASECSIALVDGDTIRLVAFTESDPELAAIWKTRFPIPLSREFFHGACILDRNVIDVPDVEAADSRFARGKSNHLPSRYQANTHVPLIDGDRAIGALALPRMHPGSLSDSQLALLKTFADQAVIAINNARLFDEVQTRTRELTESLEYQTATSEVLSVISRSQIDAQPVFDSIADRALSLCNAQFSVISMIDGPQLHLVSVRGATEAGVQSVRAVYPLSLGGQYLSARAARTRSVVHVADVLTDPAYAVRAGWRGGLAVPLLRDHQAIGTIFVGRVASGLFTERQVEVLKTFADQAVIAIENARLFEAVQARTQELQEALQQQTATAEVLKTISRSTFDLEKVLAVLVETAARLCEADCGNVTRQVGGELVRAGIYGFSKPALDLLANSKVVPGRGTLTGRTLSEAAVIRIDDVKADPEYSWSALTDLDEVRSGLGVPLLREGTPIGVLSLTRRVVRPFTDKQVELAISFADQAVIAIENMRLFEEVQARTRELSRSVSELRALSDIGQAVSSSLDVETVLNNILRHACEMSSAGGGAIYVLDEKNGTFVLEAGYNMSQELIAAVREHPIRRGDTVIGECAEQRDAVQIANIETAAGHPLVGVLRAAGFKALLAVPLLHQERAIGALLVRRKNAGSFSREIVTLLQTFASQSAIAIYNARMFRQIEEKSQELEISSQHKSQFVANMSHELRTPLAAILGYAELMQEGFHGALPDKAKATLARIQSNGKHLLGLINTVLDISKIEAGQFKLNLGEYALGSMVETVRVATESLAAAKKVALRTDVESGLPYGLGDEQRLTQVLLNLVGNAIKFTDVGEVAITAGAADGRFRVSVSDTGPGIPPEERQRIFEKFHQIDNTNTRTKGGTGLGLAIARDIVEMHGGRIWVDSVVGKGSTFRMELPIRAAAAGGGP